MAICGIYKITNLVNNKCYIGQSINIERRWRDHKQRVSNDHYQNFDAPLYCAFRKYGLTSFDFSILEECKKEDLDEREIYYISLFDSYKNGYNQDEGGKSARHYLKLSEIKVREIIDDQKNTEFSTSELAKNFGVSGSTIRAINRGSSCPLPDVIYPVRKETFYSNGRKMRISSVPDPVPQKYCIICGCSISKSSVSCRACTIEAKNTHPELFENPNTGHEKKIKNPPDCLTLAKMICETSISSVAREFGVSFPVIRNLLKKYDMPFHIKEIRKWYADRAY